MASRERERLINLPITYTEIFPMQCWQSGQACTTPTRVTAPAKSIISKLKLVDLHMMTKLTWSSQWTGGTQVR